MELDGRGRVGVASVITAAGQAEEQASLATTSCGGDVGTLNKSGRYYA